MKNLLVGINAKFIHSNLAIRYIQKYADKRDVEIEIAEYTINQSCDYILDEIIIREPDVVGFSCYIWNMSYVLQISAMLKKVRPNIIIYLGGPEVSYDSVELMTTYRNIDYVVSGEGEASVTRLLSQLEQWCSEDGTVQFGQKEAEGLSGVTYRSSDDKVIKNLQGAPLDMKDVPFVYDQTMEGLEHRIIYYESSRGCPYSCEYCLSSIEKGVRFRPLEQVYEDLKFFLDQKVMQVKFVDRTFNAKKSHCMGIWQYLKEHDNGYTNFHFEMTADILDDEMIDLFKTLRTGLVQFEIGVQSTNKETIVDIHRAVDFDKLKQRVEQIKEGHNIHLHLDLIAGLPKEDYRAFRDSFNDVMTIRPEQLQLGFLKLLKGSRMYDKKEAYGIVHREMPPYEVLMTKEMSYEDLRQLKHVEEILEAYYNSEQFVHGVEYMMTCFETPFDFFEAFSEYWDRNGYFHLKHTRYRLFEIIYEFGLNGSMVNEVFLKALLIHDLCTKEKPKKWPDFVERPEGTIDAIKNFYKNEMNMERYFSRYQGYNTRQIQRMTHIELYDYDLNKWVNQKVISKRENGPLALFYDYKDRDEMTGLCKGIKVEL